MSVVTEPLVDVTGRRRRKQREARVRWLKRLGIVTAVVAVVGTLIWVVSFSSLLAVSEVRVEGASLATVDEVIAAAGVEIGVPLARVETDAVAARVGKLAPVARAEVLRSWPRAVTIVVTERTPRLVIARDTQYDWVDPVGVIFHRATERPQGTMLAKVSGDDPTLLASVATVANALPVKVGDLTRAISAETADSITLELTDGRRVVWGSSEASDLKAQVIATLIEVPAGVYDVSSPTHPTTRKR